MYLQILITEIIDKFNLLHKEFFENRITPYFKLFN